MTPLPMQVRDEFRVLSGRPEPDAVVRSVARGPEGQSEIYALTDGARLYVYARSGGGPFDPWSAPLAELRDVRFHGDGEVQRLSLRVGERGRSYPVHVHDRPALERLLRPTAPSPPAAAPPRAVAAPRTAPPIVWFCAAMQALLHVDGTADEREEAALARIACDPGAIQRGLALWREVGTDGLIEGLATALDADQKLCLTANLIELAMVDGLLRTTEQVLLLRFRDGLGIDPGAYQTVFDVLLWKNRLSLFQPA